MAEFYPYNIWGFTKNSFNLRCVCEIFIVKCWGKMTYLANTECFTGENSNNSIVAGSRLVLCEVPDGALSRA